MDPLVIIQWQLAGIAIVQLAQIWFIYLAAKTIRREISRRGGGQ